MFETRLKRRIHATFICGSGHTGSSLLNRILSCHPAIFTPGIETYIFASQRPNIRYLSRLYRIAHLSNLNYFVEKTPHHIYSLDVIEAVIPNAKFIFTMRDGRDVAASIGSIDGDYDLGATHWINAAEIVVDALKSKPSLLFRYEDFVADPPSILRDICSFIGIEFVPDILDYHRAPRAYHGFSGDVPVDLATDKATLAKRRAYQMNQAIFDGRHRWQNELPELTVRRLTHGDGADLMRHFGYV